MNRAALSTALLSLFSLSITFAAGPLDIKREPFGRTRAGEDVELFTLSNTNGMTVKVMTYGAILYSVEVPDKNGKFANVTANRPTVADYEARSACFGAVVGRFANRIANAQFTLDGQTYPITKNAGKHHIHGGNRGFDKVVWKPKVVRGLDFVAVKLEYLSKDGEEGYPGNLQCGILYQLKSGNEWRMEYTATTDKATPINLSNHAYWNLAGVYSGTVLDQMVTIEADQYLLVDDALIPTGEFASVEGTPVDFRQPHKIGERIGDIVEKKFNGGYDHCLVVRRSKPGELVLCARMTDPASGRFMEVLTTEPGVQIYSANFPSGAFQGPQGYSYPRNLGLCFETQHYPDSPNKPNFPSTIVRPGETFRSVTLHRFGVE
jgi:aldose 1-epimerase